MVKPNPNKHVRKKLFELINPIYPCFDMGVTAKATPLKYVILSTQDKEIDKASKCGYRWECSTLLDIVCIYNGQGNTGSRVANDDMETAILGLIENIEITGYTIVNRTFEFPSNLDLSTSTQVVYRNFIRVKLLLE